MNVRARGRKHRSHREVDSGEIWSASVTWKLSDEEEGDDVRPGHLSGLLESEGEYDVEVFEMETVTLTVTDGESTSAFGESGSERRRSGGVEVERQSGIGLCLGIAHDCAGGRRGGLYPSAPDVPASSRASPPSSQPFGPDARPSLFVVRPSRAA